MQLHVPSLTNQHEIEVEALFEASSVNLVRQVAKTNQSSQLTFGDCSFHYLEQRFVVASADLAC